MTTPRKFDRNGVKKSATETNVQDLQNYSRNTDLVKPELSELLSI